MRVFLIIVIYILSSAGMWKIFVKAGRDGILSFVPFLNMFVLCEIVLGNGILFLIYLIPFANIVFTFYLNYKLSRSFGHHIGYMIGLTLLPMIFYVILGFGDDVYLGSGDKDTLKTDLHKLREWVNSKSTNTAGDEAVLRQKEKKTNFCPYCGMPIEGNSSFCARCGSPLQDYAGMREEADLPERQEFRPE